MTTIDRKKIKLVKGKDKKAEANKKLRQMLTLRDHNPWPESGELTVAAVIDLYLVAGQWNHLQEAMKKVSPPPAPQLPPRFLSRPASRF